MVYACVWVDSLRSGHGLLCIYLWCMVETWRRTNDNHTLSIPAAALMDLTRVMSLGRVKTHRELIAEDRIVTLVGAPPVAITERGFAKLCRSLRTLDKVRNLFANLD